MRMSDELKAEREEAVRMLDEHCNQLMEHFDSVQIFVTRHEEAKAGGTIYVNRGAGNWFARCGQIREWVVFEDQKIRETAKPTRE